MWYVIVNGPKGSKTTELAEDPDYAVREGLKLNRLWYFEHAIRVPMESLFSKVKEVDISQLFTQVKAELERERLGGTSLRDKIVAGPSQEDEEEAPPVKRHIPRPPPPRPKKKK